MTGPETGRPEWPAEARLMRYAREARIAADAGRSHILVPVDLVRELWDAVRLNGGLGQSSDR